MKRIAVMAALIVAMLAVPAAAMAGTASSGSGSGHPGQGEFCPNNPFFHHRHHFRHHFRHHRHHHFEFKNCFPFFPPVPPAGSCNGPTFIFTWAHHSNSFFEESGPTLSAGEQFSFDGNIFTIGTANPTASSYTLTTVNNGPSIIFGVANICSSPY